MVILRVIAGSAKGHKLKTPKGDLTRPTSDRVKESLFNIIAGFLAEAEVLDLFAGSGSLGIEALSRGAALCVFVDKRSECLAIIKENLVHTKMIERARTLSGDAMEVLRRLSGEGSRFDIIFLDPPYRKNLIEEALNIIEKNDIMKPGGIVVAERDKEDKIPESVGAVRLVRDQQYGDTVLSFYKYEGK
ncbi:MAG: 16S rRNA (guanine(966)-N(2))-methyltransferase RsmD [Clostridia bacterium]|nr:16S rRNA (guanine(966)-N(2))-methyltransferase RsmD [Clostridia bacterium]